MRIMVGCDHGGVELKGKIVLYLGSLGYQVEDIGTHGLESVDYPYYAVKVALAVAGGDVERGILVCGSGIGMCIAANRIPGIRAAQVAESYAAKMSRRHNDTNVLCLGGRFIGPDLAYEIVQVWLKEPFEGGRHQRRVELIESLVQSHEAASRKLSIA